MKYVVMEVQKEGLVMKVPIIFPNTLTHSEVAENIQNHYRRERYLCQPVSAGFIRVDNMTITSERSESLKLGPHPDDRELILMNDYCHGLI